MFEWAAKASGSPSLFRFPIAESATARVSSFTPLVARSSPWLNGQNADGEQNATTTVRRDFVPMTVYAAKFLELEMKLIWANVWQAARREEEINEVGASVKSEIGRDRSSACAAHPALSGSLTTPARTIVCPSRVGSGNPFR